MTGVGLAGWVADLQRHAARAEPLDTGELLDVLDGAAHKAVEGLPGAALPLRLPKRRVAELVRCPRLAVASAAAPPPAMSAPLVMGRLVEVAAHVVVLDRLTAGELAAPDRLLEVVLGACRALGDPVADAVDAMDAVTSAAVAEDLAEMAGQFARSWGRPPAMTWLRCEDRLELPLATTDDAGPGVVVAGRVDLSFGAPPRLRAPGEPRGLVELKSTRTFIDPIEEAAWYALLAGCVEGTAPHGTALWAPDDGGPTSIGRLAAFAVSASSLESAAMRLVDVLTVAGALAAGEKPAEQPGWWCGRCPDRTRCPSSEAASAPEDLDLAPDDDTDDDAF
jgi:hypothetical protein